MIKSVVRHVKFSPSEISNLFIDNTDYLGIEYWYNDAKDYIKQIKESMSKK